MFSLLFSFMPCVGALALFTGGIGLVLGGIGLLVAGGSNHGKGLPISGIVVNVVSMLIAVAWLGLLANLSSIARNEEVETGDALKISAGQLCREYNANIVNADERYKGKVLEVTGQVKLVSKERIGRITVELGSRDDSVDCDFGSSTRSELAGIENGQTVTIRGKCKGVDRRSKYVVLGSCKMVTSSPAGEAPAGETVKVEATKLLDAYRSDEKAANKAYKGKLVEVAGLVSEVNDDDRKELVVQLQAEGDRYVECRLTPEASRAAGPLKVGQKLTLRGICSGLQDDDRYVLVENATIVLGARAGGPGEGATQRPRDNTVE
jgi:hypothetical protein